MMVFHDKSGPNPFLLLFSKKCRFSAFQIYLVNIYKNIFSSFIFYLVKIRYPRDTLKSLWYIGIDSHTLLCYSVKVINENDPVIGSFLESEDTIYDVSVYLFHIFFWHISKLNTKNNRMFSLSLWWDCFRECRSIFGRWHIRLRYAYILPAGVLQNPEKSWIIDFRPRRVFTNTSENPLL